MNQFEIKMYYDTPELPAEIDNFEEVKAAISEALKEYSTDAIVTADSVKDAEKTRAHLRKVKEQIENYRKDAKAAYLEKFTKLETQCKELSGLIEQPITAIDGKIKDFENAENEKKWAELAAFFDALCVPKWLTLEEIINPKWKNKTATVDKLRQEIGFTVSKLEDDYTELRLMYEESPLWTAISQKFAETKDKSKVLVYAAYLERERAEEEKRAAAIQKAKAEQALAAAREESAKSAICGQEEPQAVTNSETEQNANTAALDASTQMISGAFRVTGTKEQIKALAAFMKQNGIRYEVIK